MPERQVGNQVFNRFGGATDVEYSADSSFEMHMGVKHNMIFDFSIFICCPDLGLI